MNKPPELIPDPPVVGGETITDRLLRLHTIRTSRSKDAAKDALIAFVRLLAVQQARQDHEEEMDGKTRCDLCKVFLGSAE